MKNNFNDDLLEYVSNIDSDVYSISNLPEEMIAVIFAYVSRSPKSFRENIRKVTEEKASKFHEKWVLNFGHASVAELAVAHICLENVSRLFSSILERANLFISPIEFSQRYQKPKKGAFYIPPELDNYINLKDEYIDFQNYSYETYEKLNAKLLEYHLNNNSKKKEENEKTYISKWEKIAFEDARYVLSLAVFTNLGFTSNARALENLLMKLLSSKYYEVREKAKEIKKEAKNVLPTLIKYAEENEYYKSLHKEKYFDIACNIDKDELEEDVKLISCNYENEKDALISLLSPILSIQNSCSINQTNNKLAGLSLTELIEIFNSSIKNIGLYDEPWENFHQIRYTFELKISEACWHQLLRHRKTDFFVSDPSVKNGFEIPPNIKNANLENSVIEVIKTSATLFNKIKEIQDISHLNSYVVLNIHKRRVIASIDLWELYNLINLRLTPHAQWDIKNIVLNIIEKIKKIHPNIIKPSIIRVNNKSS